MLAELKIAAVTMGWNFQPTFVSLDFELGAILAFKFNFPLVKFLGIIQFLGNFLNYSYLMILML